MKPKKIFAILMAAQLLLLNGVACAETEEETKAPEQQSETEKNTAETVLDRRDVPDDLPDITFNGKDFRFYVNEGEYFQLVSEDTSGIGLDSAIYERNQRVEERFDVKISANFSLGQESQDVVLSYMQVDEHIAEVYDCWHRMGLTPPAYNMSLNWLDMPHINWEQPWWNQKSNENSTINGKMWTVTGDLAVTAVQDTWAIAFNMELIEDYGYTSEQFYDLVLDGEWTIDKLIEIGSSIYVDEDGSQTKTEGDIYGYVNNATIRTMPWVTAIGENYFTKTEDGMSLNVAIGTEKVYIALEKLINFHYNTKGAYTYYFEDRMGGKDNDKLAVTYATNALASFTEGRAAMYTTTFEACYTTFRDLNSITVCSPSRSMTRHRRNT